MLEDAGDGMGGGDAAGRVPECATATHMHARGCRNFKKASRGRGVMHAKAFTGISGACIYTEEGVSIQINRNTRAFVLVYSYRDTPKYLIFTDNDSPCLWVCKGSGYRVAREGES